MGEFTIANIKLVFGFIGAVLLMVFVCAPSLYGKFWRVAKDVGFIKAKKS
jgi:hypothetical protein